MKIPCCLLGLLVALPMASQAGLVISADAGDSPLAITGWLDEDTGFSGNLRLTARHDPSEGADTGRVSILMLASDLRRGDGKFTVSRQNVAVGGNPVLQPGVPQDFQVTVSGIREPGTYRGMLELLPSGPREPRRPRSTSR